MASIEQLEGLQRRIKLVVAADKIEQRYQARLHEEQKKYDRKGFRKGKVPLDVVSKDIGGPLRNRLLGDFIQEALQEALSLEAIKVAGQPNVDVGDYEPNKDLEFTATFEVFPEFTLKELEGVNFERESAEVDDADINDMLQRLARQQGEWLDVERASQTGDQVVIDFEGLLDGEAFEGGSSKDFSLELGSNSMIEGFEKGLTGKKAGEEFDLKVTFPKEYHVAKLAGKPAVFKTKVSKVQESKATELNDEFAKKLGIESGGLEELKKKIRVNLEQELKRTLSQKFKEQVLDKLIELNPIEIPNALLEAEISHLQNMTRQQFAQQQHMKELPDLDLPRDPYVEQARKRVILGLLLAEGIRIHEVKADAEAVRAKIEEIAAGGEKPEELVKYYYQNQQLIGEIESVVLEEQVIDNLLKQAEVNEKTISYQEAMKKTQETE